MMLSTKLAGALSGIARGENFFEPGMVIEWLKCILEILNKTIAAADAVRTKRFLPPERFACYRRELFAIREEILELVTQLRARRPKCRRAQNPLKSPEKYARFDETEC
jgi:hypothetical protein